MELVPINERPDTNAEIIKDPLCAETLQQCIDFYEKVGFELPWICYYARENGRLVGNAAFKGRPVDGTVEIAYGTFEDLRGQGVGTRICRKLVDLAVRTDPSVRITARTLPEKNFSTRILEKSGFVFVGPVDDPDDGEVWEWEYVKARSE